MLNITFCLFCAATLFSLARLENLENTKKLGSVSYHPITFPAKLKKGERISIPLTHIFIFALILIRSGDIETNPENKLFKISKYHSKPHASLKKIVVTWVKTQFWGFLKLGLRKKMMIP